jgi:hypothetical protein
MKSWEEKLDHVISKLPVLTLDKEYYKTVCTSTFARIKNIPGYKWNSMKTIKSHTTLLKASAAVLNVEEDYGLSKVSISHSLL